MFFNLLRNKKLEMIEATESQIREWLPNVRSDVLNNVVLSITQHIKTSKEFKKGNSFNLRFDSHPPKWLRAIYDHEHIDYGHVFKSPKQISLNFTEKTVTCSVGPEEPKIIYGRTQIPTEA